MERREFLKSALAGSALLTSSQIPLRGAQIAEDHTSEFYLLRRYRLATGPQRKWCDEFFRDALIPAANRMGIKPVGVFTVMIGPETPTIYILMPSRSLETLVDIEARLLDDTEYLKSGTAFLNASALQPSFDGLEVSLMRAFPHMPRLRLPNATATHSSRLFELRTYHSRSQAEHSRKVEMIDTAEIELETRTGLGPVFYGDTLIGPHMPNLVYLLSFESLAARERGFAAFG